MSTPLSGINQPFKGIVLVIGATLLFSTHDALSKYLSGFYPVIMVVWARYLVHTLLMAGIFLPQSGLRVLRTKRPLWQLARALCLLGTSLFFTTALLYIPLAEATAVNFLAPVLVTALSVPLLKERVTRGQWIAVICGFIGVLIVLRPTEVNWAALAALGVALSMALNNLLIKRIPLKQPIAQTLFFTNVLSMPFILALALWEGGDWQWQMWWPAFGSSALIMVYAGLCVVAYRKAEASKIASAEYTGLLMAVAIGVWLFDEQPGLPLLLGCLCIILPLVAMARGKSKPLAEPAV